MLSWVFYAEVLAARLGHHDTFTWDLTLLYFQCNGRPQGDTVE